MKRVLVTSMFLTGLLAVSAQAQEPAAPTPAPAATPLPAAPGGYPDEYILRPLTLNAGMVEVYVPVTINLTKDWVGKPILIGPEVGYGIDDKLELRLIHDRGLCFNGKKDIPGQTIDACGDKVYNDMGVVARYSVQRQAQMELAAQGGLVFKSLDPAWMALRVGVILKYVAAPLAVYVSPTVDLGMTKRSEGNKEYVNVPVKIAFQANPQLAPFVVTGIEGPADGFSDNYKVPLGVGANFVAQHGLDVGAELLFPRMATGGDGGGTDERALIVYAAWRNQ